MMTIETESPKSAPLSSQTDEELKIEELPLLRVEKGEKTTVEQMKRYGYKLIQDNYHYGDQNSEQWFRNDVGWAIRHQDSGEIIGTYNSY